MVCDESELVVSPEIAADKRERVMLVTEVFVLSDEMPDVGNYSSSVINMFIKVPAFKELKSVPYKSTVLVNLQDAQ